MQELQKKLAEKEAEIANLAICLENREHEKTNEVSSNNTVITPQDIKEFVEFVSIQPQEGGELWCLIFAL